MLIKLFFMKSEVLRDDKMSDPSSEHDSADTFISDSMTSTATKDYC